MSSRTVYRWSGLALLVGSLLGVIDTLLGAILFPGHHETAQQMLSTPYTISTALYLAWSLLLVLGLPGFYLRQTARAGALGFTGFVLLWVALLLMGVAYAAVVLTIFPYLAQAAPQLLPSAGGQPLRMIFLLILGPVLLFSAGSMLLGIATVRAHVFPRWVGLLLVIVSVLVFLVWLPFPAAVGIVSETVANLALFVAFAWSGYLLVTQNREMVGVAPRFTTEAV